MRAPACHDRNSAASAAANGLPRKGGERSLELDIRLELLHALRGPGVRLTHREIAAFIGASVSYVLELERRALRKLRREAARRGLSSQDIASFLS
jgi:hypothetical protein